MADRGRFVRTQRLVRCPHLAAIAVIIATVASAVQAEPFYRIEPVGDSITAGATSSGAYTFGYRGPLYTKLTNAGYNFQFVGASGEPWNWNPQDHKDLYPPTNIASPDLRYTTPNDDGNRGYFGQHTSFIRDNIGSWLSVDNPDIILLMIGTNDVAKGSTAEPTATEQALNAAVNTIVTNKPNAKVIVAQITPWNDNSANANTGVKKYNAYIKNTLVPAYQALGKNVTTVDQYATFLKADGTINSALISDSVHPNAAGYAAMANTWLAGIQAVTVPEPGTVALLLIGVPFLPAIRRRWFSV